MQFQYLPDTLKTMRERVANLVSLTTLLGTPVTDPQGTLRGRLQDIAVGTGNEAGRVAGLVLKTKDGKKLIPASHVRQTPSGSLELTDVSLLLPLRSDENYLFLQQDLVDRQIIDIHGRKVVRVNDVDLEWFSQGARGHLRVTEVEVGLQGAVRRLFKGLMPRKNLESFSRYFSARVIPWEFVDVIEVDPARRVKLKIEHERLAQLHPSDIAEILEDLAPAEREAIFTALDEETAAEALEEADPKLQKSLVDSLDHERIADIVEEMDPGAAADLLAELPEYKSEAILEEMEPEERQEVEELLEFREDSAAGRMTTEFVQVPYEATVGDAIQALRQFEGDPESVTEVYLADSDDVLKGVVSLARVVMALPGTHIRVLAEPNFISCQSDMHQKEVAELFDKYNLRALPVLDPEARIVGVVQAEHVIAFLREER